MITINRSMAASIATLIIALLFVLSCNTEGYVNDDDVNLSNDNDGTDNVVGDDDDVPEAATKLVGIVVDAYTQPVEGVTVALLNTDYFTTTDSNGHFVLENVTPTERAIVSFRKNAYARSSVPLEIFEGVENTVLQRLALIDHMLYFEASDGYNFEDDSALKLEFPSNNIVDSSGKIYDGSVVVEVTVFDLVSDVDSGNEIFAAPGDFTAVNGVGEDKVLESFGMVQVNMMTPTGEELQLGSTPSLVRLPVQNLGIAPAVGDEIPAWSYDEALGKWAEETVGTVAEFNGELVWEFEAPHFSTWNCDRPISTHGCLTGVVTDVQGTPRSGATVRAVGITYISTTTARTDQDGSFCLEVKNGETVWAEISYTLAGQTATQRTDPVTVPGGTASCSIGSQSCVDLGELPVDIQTCISGVVVDASNSGLADMQVVSPNGGVATTASDGSFCLTVPVFQSTDIFVLTEIDEIGYQPVRLYAQPGLPDCQGGCSNVAILRSYGNTSCAHGSVVINGEVATNILVEVYDPVYPTTRVYSTLTNSDGSFCAAVPAGSSAIVQVGSGDNLCASEAFSTDNLGGEECADSGQGGECYSLEEFVCSL